MVDIARLQIKIDSSGIRVAGRELDGLARKGTQVGSQLTTRLTLPLVAGMGAAVREAALLEGAFDKFDVVFQGMTDEMREFVDVYNTEFPISRRETVQLAASLQDLLVPMGINRKEAAGMTQDWLELAGALSAFNDVPIQQVLQAISSGMAGQSEALRRYGIDARATVLENIALEEGLIRVGEAMDEQVRQQVLLIQATKQSADAIGGLEEQKGSLLWQTEELKRDVKDLAAVYGQELIPIASDMIGVAKDVSTWFKGLDDDTRQLVIRAGLLGAALGPATLGVSWALRIMIPLVTKSATAVRTLTAAMVANPYLAVGAAILAIGTQSFLVTRRINSLNDAINEALNSDIDTQILEDVNNLIAQTADRLEGVQSAESMFGVQSREAAELQEKLNELVELRNQMAGNELDAIISEKEAQNARDAEQAVDDLISSINGIRPAVENIRPIDEVLFPDEDLFRRIDQHMDEFNSSFREALEAVQALPPSFDDLQATIAFFEDVDFSHRLGMPDVKKDVEEVNQAARDLGFTFSSAFEDAIVKGDEFRDVLDGIFQDVLRILTRLLVTEPLGNALTNALSGISFGGGASAESVDDALITSEGRVIKFHPDDNILAMKDMSPVFNNQNSTTVNTPVNVTVVNQSDSQIDVQETRGPGGERQVEVFVRNAVKGLMNSGQLDRTMANNYGIRRKGVNYG